MPGPPVLADLEHGAHVGDALDHLAHVVVAQAVLRHDEAQLALVGGFPFGHRPLEVGEVLLGDGHRFRLVGDRDVHHAVGPLHRHGADFLGLEDA